MPGLPRVGNGWNANGHRRHGSFVCGALFDGVVSILVILAYGMLHSRRSRRPEVSMTDPTPQNKAPPADDEDPAEARTS